MPEEQDNTSKNGDRWVSHLINEARNSNPLVADGVFARMEFLLKGEVSELELTPANLKKVATQLIGDMVPKPAEPGRHNED